MPAPFFDDLLRYLFFYDSDFLFNMQLKRSFIKKPQVQESVGKLDPTP